MMKSVMGKSVELEYSGTGRAIHGHSKKNFSGTMTYQCIRGKIYYFKYYILLPMVNILLLILYFILPTQLVKKSLI